MPPLPLLDPDTLRRLCRARDFLAARTREPVQLAAAARAACLSPFHFQRLFSRAFGESPHRFLTRRRIELAKRLLAADHLSVTEVCFETGYSSLGSFSAKFHAMVGRPPSAWRRELRRQVGYQAQWRIAFVPSCFLQRLYPGEGEGGGVPFPPGGVAAAPPVANRGIPAGRKGIEGMRGAIR